ncbi:MAG: T9SS type A sorting domain-containing protein [Bacteroidetes bacterium]|nr:T9SS type A sorting domain-containing protein [Bacteroidota bacterium]
MNNKFTIFLVSVIFTVFCNINIQAQSPADLDVGVSIQPIFTSPAEAYGIAVSMNPNYDADTEDPADNELEVLFGQTTTYDATAQSTLLLNNTKYYWWYLNDVAGTWVYVGGFTTTVGATIGLIAPTGGIELNSDIATLSWNSTVSGGNELYDVFFSDADPGDTFAGTTPNEADLTVKTFELNNLPPNATYYWQVRVKTATGAIVSYSDVETFRTSGDLMIPVPAAPVQGLVLNSTSPYLYWGSYNNHPDIVYQACYSLTETIGGVTSFPYQLNDGVTTSWTHNRYIQVSDLTPGEVYYWQVRASDDGGVASFSDWSDPVSFEIYGTGAASAPIPVYPSGGISIYASSVMTYWYMLGNSSGLQYIVRYGTDSTMDGTDPTMLENADNTTATSSMYKQLAHLVDGETYYWQVQTTGGAWSDVHSFIVKTSAETQRIPIPYHPVNNYVETTRRPTLYYYVFGYSYGLEYEVQYSNLLNAGALDNPTLLGPTSDLYINIETDLDLNTTYYWQVRSISGTTPSDWSEISTFEIDQNAENVSIIPTPSYPVGGTVVDSKTPDYNWVVNGNYSHLEFQVRYATHDNTTDGELDAPFAAVTGWSTDLSVTQDVNLIPGAMYYWQVRSRLASTHDGESKFSTLANFVVSAGAAPVMVILGSPVAAVQIGTSTPTFSWILPTQSTSELSYEVEIADNEQMASPQVMNADNLSVEAQNLTDGQQYFWRVRSKTDAGEYSLYSGQASFTVNSSITTLEEVSGIPIEFNVSQNYPNPFNPSTTIKFSLPAAEKVSVKVFDLLGREMITLLDTQLEAGNHSVVWNGENQFGNAVSTGIYFYKVKSGSNVVTRKMILMK